jgi:two-component system, response regulator PdtaR
MVTPPTAAPKRVARILVVEDEALIAMELSDRLTTLGYETCGPCARGEDALEIIKSHPPDLVLMDINLAGSFSGLDTAERLLKTHDVPVVFLTAYSDASLVERALKTEAYGFLIKPYQEREFQLTIEFALHRHAAQRETRELNAQLQTALSEVKTLEGLLPICGHCKKIRDEDQEWHGMEAFIAQRAAVSFSHSFCPDCFAAEMAAIPKAAPAELSLPA